ncbi:MAG: hypothetical protein AB1546_12365 [bacterium]
MRVILPLLFAIVMILAAGCGGGGGSGTVSPESESGGDVRVVKKSLANQTRYYPSQYEWTLFNNTIGFVWTTAVGTRAGLSASMSNPFREVGVMFLPTDNYPNAGTVEFYIDAQLVGTLDLSKDTPYEGYRDDFVTYYQIATDLPDTMHTVTMVIATGTVAFDGWKMRHGNIIYHFDASEINSYEEETIDAVNEIRNAVEDYAEGYGAYPDPGTDDVVSFLYATTTYLADIPKNAFTGDDIAQSDAYSAGDYLYTYNSPTSYELIAYGGKGELYTLTPDSAETELLSLTLTSPPNHTTTTNSSVTFAGTATADANITISSGVDGYTSFPSNGSFSKEIVLKEGRNNITVALTDEYGNSINLIRTITKDTTAPTINLIDPFPPVGSAGSEVINVYSTPTTVRGYAEPGSTVTVNGTSVAQDSLGVFTYSMALQTGNNTLTIAATDRFGNQNIKTYTIVLVVSG